MKIVLVMSAPSLDATGNKNEKSNNVKLRETGKTNAQTGKDGNICGRAKWLIIYAKWQNKD